MAKGITIIMIPIIKKESTTVMIARDMHFEKAMSLRLIGISR